MFIAETWRQSKSKINFKKPFCDLKEPDVTIGRPKGGIIGICSEPLNGRIKIIEVDPEKKWVICKLENIILACCYFPPSYSREKINNFIYQVKVHSNHGMSKCFVVGDFNIRLGDLTGDSYQDSSTRCSLLLDWVDNPNWTLLSPNEGKWTTVTANGKGIPDHVICSSSANRGVWNYTVFEDKLIESDHRPLVVTFGLDTVVRKLEFDRWNIMKLKNEDVQSQYKNILLQTKTPVLNSISSILEDLKTRRGNTITNTEAATLAETSLKHSAHG